MILKHCSDFNLAVAQAACTVVPSRETWRPETPQSCRKHCDLQGDWNHSWMDDGTTSRAPAPCKGGKRHGPVQTTLLKILTGAPPPFDREAAGPRAVLPVSGLAQHPISVRVTHRARIVYGSPTPTREGISSSRTISTQWLTRITGSGQVLCYFFVAGSCGRCRDSRASCQY